MPPAKTRRWCALATGAWLLVALGAQPLAAEDPLAKAQTAVTYSERPDAGPYLESGRDLGAGGLRTAIDINSLVKLDVDSETLEQLLRPYLPAAQADPDLQLLAKRLEALRQAVAQLQALTVAYRDEAKL